MVSEFKNPFINSKLHYFVLSMGIKHFHTCIEPFFEPITLQNSVLIVDGGVCNRICENASDDPRLGSDYDLIYEAVDQYFRRLLSCNVIPIVVMDGLYDERKEATMQERLQLSLKELTIYNKNKHNFFTKNLRAFPIFKTNVFRDVLENLNISFVRCDFEADGELIELAKKFDCPILSHDSDFALCNGITFIPYKSINSNSFTGDGYIHCEKFNREKFLETYNLLASNLPLLAVIFNSDCWKRNVFSSLFPGIGTDDIFLKMTVATNWLRDKTVDSAIEEIASRISQRDNETIEDVKKKIVGIIDLYGDVPNSSTTVADIIMEDDVLRNRLRALNHQLTRNVKDMTQDPYNVPPEVLNLVRLCRIPAITLDMINFNKFLCRAHPFEDIKKDSIHKPSMRLIRGIFGILVRNLNPKPLLTVNMRVKNVMLEHVVEALSFDALSLPNGELNNIQKRSILNEIIFQSQENFDLENFDDDWNIFSLALIYIKFECGEEFDEYYIHSILLTALVLQTVKKYKNNEIPIGVVDSNASIPSDYLKALRLRALEKIDRSARFLRVRRRNKYRLNNISYIHMYYSFNESLEYLIQIFELLQLPGEIHIQDFINGSFFLSILKGLESSNGWRNYVKDLSNNDRDFINAYEKIVEGLSGFLPLTN